MNLLKRLGIEQPIFLAPMAGTATPELAAAVSNAGGLGALGLGSSKLEQAYAGVAKLRTLTNKPFQLNFFCHKNQLLDEVRSQVWSEYLRPYFARYQIEPKAEIKKLYSSFIENDDWLTFILDTQPQAVSFHFGLPLAHQLEAIKAAGILTMVSVSQLSEALSAQAAGIDVLIAQGVEAGGHRAMFNAKLEPAIDTSSLLQLLKQRIDLPIVVAGGIMDGVQVRQYLAQGASAAQLGTAFVQCAESAASDAYRKALFETTVTQISDDISGRPARGLVSHWHTEVGAPERPEHAGYPFSYDLGKQLNSAAAKQGDYAFHSFWAGQGVARIRNMNATELMQTLIGELQAPPL